MSCNRCGGPLGTSRDLTCLGCSALATLSDELRGEWTSASIRGIATDLLVSTSRQVRALRLGTLRIGREGTEAAPVEAARPPVKAEVPAFPRTQEALQRLKQEEESYEYSEEADSPQVVSSKKKEGSSEVGGLAAKAKASHPAVQLTSAGKAQQRRDRSREAPSELPQRKASPAREDRRKASPRTRSPARHERRAHKHHGDRPRRRSGKGRHREREEDGESSAARTADSVRPGPEVERLPQRHLTLVDDRKVPATSARSSKKWRPPRHR